MTATIASADPHAPERFTDPAHGDVHWFTLFSSDQTPTTAMNAGILVIPAHGGRLAPHRHAQPEIYFVATGTGILTIDGASTVISAGAAAFIPGDAQHALVNDGPNELRIFYVFPTGRFSDVVYRFDPD